MTNSLRLLGLDIGGANLKAAHTSGTARSEPYELWKNPRGLPEALDHLIRRMSDADALAVTMTGELCDCFASKREGVPCILDAVEAVARKRVVHVWRTDGRFVDLSQARAEPLLVAAANWLALATFAARFAPEGPALLIDIGSTTTDIVPLMDRKPIPQARTDPDRLRVGELVYLGVRRTPLCALLHEGYAAELFATTQDVFLVLGFGVPEDEGDHATADGRPATRAAAEARLARMLGADLETSTAKERQMVAAAAHQILIQRLAAAVEAVARRLPGRILNIITSGSGEFLTSAVLDKQTAFTLSKPVFSLSRKLGPEISTAACAYAVATLAAERFREI